MIKRRGLSYKKRVEEINRIYDRYARSGLSNREIWRRYVYPIYGITERTFYNLLNAAADTRNHIDENERRLLYFNFSDHEE